MNVAVTNHKVVSEAEWLKERQRLLNKEKEFTRLQEELSLERRGLPRGQSDQAVSIRPSRGQTDAGRFI